MDYEIIDLRTRIDLFENAANWFSSKWRVPKEAYLFDMKRSLAASTGIPSWYVVLYNDKIIAGIGIIDNDFHERKDLTPNVCALYVEEEYRNKGIAGNLLNRVVEDMRKKGFIKLYLITDHTTFYERYGWTYLFDVKCDDGESSRIYQHIARNS